MAEAKEEKKEGRGYKREATASPETEPDLVKERKAKRAKAMEEGGKRHMIVAVNNELATGMDEEVAAKLWYDIEGMLVKERGEDGKRVMIVWAEIKHGRVRIITGTDEGAGIVRTIIEGNLPSGTRVFSPDELSDD